MLSTWMNSFPHHSTLRATLGEASISLSPFIHTAVGLGNPVYGMLIWKFWPAFTVISLTPDMSNLGLAETQNGSWIYICKYNEHWNLKLEIPNTFTMMPFTRDT